MTPQLPALAIQCDGDTGRQQAVKTECMCTISIYVLVYLQHQASPTYKPPLSTSIHSLYSSEWTSRSLVQLSLCAMGDLLRPVYKTDTSMLEPVSLITDLTERGTVLVLGYKLGP